MNHIKIELKWAFIFTIMSLCWMLLEKTLGWHDESIADHWWLTLLFVPFGILMTVLVMREKRRRFYKTEGFTWWNGFLTGLKMTIFIAILSPFAQYITHNYITPEYFNNVINYSVTDQRMTLEAANDYFNLNSYVLQAVIGAIIGGVVTSAIVAVFMRRNPRAQSQSITAE